MSNFPRTMKTVSSIYEVIYSTSAWTWLFLYVFTNPSQTALHRQSLMVWWVSYSRAYFGLLANAAERKTAFGVECRYSCGI
ncbi:hypothetical protein BDW42DRAFT_164704 [Aspergillus taichungensis]|uniref:Uncharacterized protein n=1 Tax=Aspergillus taichungensis TaxID=482145 RepID=A0A2J5I1A2_9EURO|nr:hypothetical protein BDW42DRAFT_164704 [Aspergillus taichungensis]